MATRLERFLSHGSICNTEPGKVTGTLWFIDAEEPVTLELEGNCHRDLAGGLLVFERPDPELEPGESVPQIARLQRGVAGDITASKKVLCHEPPAEGLDACRPTLANGLCIEWYDESGERFVIDSIEFYLYAGDHEWQMDAAGEQELLRENTRRFHDYIDTIAGRISDDEGDGEFENELPLDEFKWEERLKESDRITAAYVEAIDKYQDLPNQDKLVAAAMGWNQVAEAGMGDDGDLDDDGDDDDDDDDDSILLEGLLSFGYDDDDDEDDFGSEVWVDEDARDEENHPLYEQSQEFSIRLHREAQEMGILEPDDDTRDDDLGPVQTLVFASMDLSAKLAGALNGISANLDPEPGLVVAWLKRGLPIVGRALGASESALAAGRAPQDWIERARKELFELRAAMLDLIQEFRRQLP